MRNIAIWITVGFGTIFQSPSSMAFVAGATWSASPDSADTESTMEYKEEVVGKHIPDILFQAPTPFPSLFPTRSYDTPYPTIAEDFPTFEPTVSPTPKPTTKSPTPLPSTKQPTPLPTVAVTLAPTTSSPTTKSPTTASPTTKSPTTASPTNSPNATPTKSPTTRSPTKSPVEAPTKAPTDPSTKSPTDSPTKSPTNSPVENGAPTNNPVVSTAPTRSPTNFPTVGPTESPTAAQIGHLPTDSPTSDGGLGAGKSGSSILDRPEVMNSIIGAAGAGLLLLVLVALILVVRKRNSIRRSKRRSDENGLAFYEAHLGNEKNIAGFSSRFNDGGAPDSPPPPMASFTNNDSITRTQKSKLIDGPPPGLGLEGQSALRGGDRPITPPRLPKAGVPYAKIRQTEF